MDSDFHSALLARAFDDQCITSLEELKEWFNDFVELNEEQLRDDIASRARADPRNPARHRGAAGGGRKKSMVFGMLEAGASRGTRKRSSHGSQMKRILGAGIDDDDDQDAPPLLGFASAANRRKSRVLDVRALSGRMSPASSHPSPSVAGVKGRSPGAASRLSPSLAAGNEWGDMSRSANVDDGEGGETKGLRFSPVATSSTVDSPPKSALRGGDRSVLGASRRRSISGGANDDGGVTFVVPPSASVRIADPNVASADEPLEEQAPDTAVPTASGGEASLNASANRKSVKSSARFRVVDAFGEESAIPEYEGAEGGAAPTVVIEAPPANTSDGVHADTGNERAVPARPSLIAIPPVRTVAAAKAPGSPSVNFMLADVFGSQNPSDNARSPVDHLGDRRDSEGATSDASHKSPLEKKRVVSFGGSKKDERNSDEEDKISSSDATATPTGLGAPKQSKLGMVKTASMGVRLLQKLNKKVTTKNDADRAFTMFGEVTAAPNIGSGDTEHESPEALIADDSHRAEAANLPGRSGDPSTAEALTHSMRRIAEREKNQPVLTHVMSTLEMKELLMHENYFNADQLKLQRFLSISRVFEYFLADFSLFLIIYNAYTVAAHVGLGSAKISHHLATASLVLDIFNFVLVLGVNMFLPFEEQGHVRSDPIAIIKRYLSHPGLAVFDIVSTFPILLVTTAIGKTHYEWTRLNLLLREVRLPKMLEKLEEQLPQTLHPSAMRLLGYFLYLIVIVTHLATFLMFVLRRGEEDDVQSWLNLSKHEQYDHDPWYWFSRTWLISLQLVADKAMPYPHTDVQFYAALLCVVVGLLALAVILASFDEIIVTEIEEGNVLGKKIDDAMAAMDDLRVPDALKREIVEYYRSMYDINRSFDFNSDDLLAELPEMLHDDIEFECNARIIRSIPLFAEPAQNPDFVRLLAGELQQLVIIPGAPIVQRGEVGDCMFFVSVGLCAVLAPDGSEDAVLGAGSFFGEVTLLFGGERDRTIIAKTLCVCYVVTDEQFEGIVEAYPEALDGILKSAVRQMKQNAVMLGERLDEEVDALMADVSGAVPAIDPNDAADDDEVMDDEEIRQMVAARMKFGHRASRSAKGGFGSVMAVLSENDDDDDYRDESELHDRAAPFAADNEDDESSQNTNTGNPLAGLGQERRANSVSRDDRHRETPPTTSRSRRRSSSAATGDGTDNGVAGDGDDDVRRPSSGAARLLIPQRTGSLRGSSGRIGFVLKETFGAS